MSISELHNWECAIEKLSGDNADKMLAIAQDIYDTAFVRGKNYMLLEQTKESDDIVHNTIIIPRGATNRDMFKVVFGYEPATNEVICNKADWCGGSEPCNYCTCNSDAIGGEKDWWNTPYKAESEE